jgi:hypothetical protein
LLNNIERRYKNKMTKQKGIYRNISGDKVTLELDNGEIIHSPTDNVKKYLGKGMIEEGTEIVYSIDRDNNLAFIQVVENGVPKKAKKEEKPGKNDGCISRYSALKNSVQIAVSKGGSALEVSNILETARMFDEFINEKAA